MTLLSKERIQEFHELEGDGLDPYPLVEAAFLAHELLAGLQELIEFAAVADHGESQGLRITPSPKCHRL